MPPSDNFSCLHSICSKSINKSLNFCLMDLWFYTIGLMLATICLYFYAFVIFPDERGEGVQRGKLDL